MKRCRKGVFRYRRELTNDPNKEATLRWSGADWPSSCLALPQYKFIHPFLICCASNLIKGKSGFFHASYRQQQHCDKGDGRLIQFYRMYNNILLLFGVVAVSFVGGRIGRINGVLYAFQTWYME